VVVLGWDEKRIKKYIREQAKVHKGPDFLILSHLRAPFRLAFGLGGKIPWEYV
jgi:hypothetical protein